MLALISVTTICNKITWRAIFFSLAPTSKSVMMIAAFSGGVKHCCCTSPTSLLKLFVLFEPAQEFIELIMVRIFDDQLASAFVARFNFHAVSKIRAHFFLQALCVAAKPCLLYTSPSPRD